MRNIVLDLDSTLINTCEEQNSLKLFKKLKIYTKNHDLRNKIYCLNMRKGGETIFAWGVFRPHLDEFIEYCFKNFDNVMVWSAGTKVYVDQVVERVFRKRKSELKLILSRNNCTYEEDDPDTLTKVMEKLVNGYDWMDLSNTVIVDDNIKTFRFNDENALQIKEFLIDYNSETLLKDIRECSDDSLCNLIEWFENTPEFWNDDVRNSVPLNKIF